MIKNTALKLTVLCFQCFLYGMGTDSIETVDQDLDWESRSRQQGCGSGSQLDPESIGSVDLDPDPGGQK
jgi:hypothetical protein